MRRRLFLGRALSALAVPASGSVHARQASGVPLIGLLMGYPQDHPDRPTNIAAFHDGLRRAGLEPGRAVRIEERWAGIDPVRARSLAQRRGQAAVSR